MTALWLFLRAYWKPLCIIGLAIAAVSILEWWVHSKDQQGYKRAKVEDAAELQKAREHWNEVKSEIDRERYEERAELQARVSQLRARGKPIRLCTSSDQVRTPASASGAFGAGPNDGQAPGVGDDIQPRLVEYGASCEDLRQRLIAIKAWQASLSR